jgi:cytochrome c
MPASPGQAATGEKSMNRSFLKMLPLLAALGLPGATHDAVARDPVDGEALAAAKCGRCHAVGQSDPSPQRITTPFRQLYERWPIEMLVEARKTGVIDGHDEMPGFHFTSEEIVALLRHIDSLGPPGSPSYLPAEPGKPTR